MEEKDIEAYVRCEFPKQPNANEELYIQLAVRLISQEWQKKQRLSEALESMRIALEACMQAKLQLEAKAQFPRNMQDQIRRASTEGPRAKTE